MKAVRGALLRLIRCPGRNAALIGGIAVFVCFSAIGFYLDSLWDSYMRSFSETDGVYIWLAAEDADTDVPEDLLQEAGRLPHVMGYACWNETTAFLADAAAAAPGNTVFDGNETNGEIQLLASTDTASNSYFLQKGYTLVDGDFPGGQEVLVGEQTAMQNQWNTGDSIQIFLADTGEFLELSICGIYRMPGAKGQGQRQKKEELFFLDYATLPLGGAKNEYELYIDDYAAVQSVKKQIDRLLSDRDTVACNDSISNAARGTSGFSGRLAMVKDLMLGVTYLTAVVVLFCMGWLWMKGHYQEAGIYIALGRSRIEILGEFLLEILALSTGTIVLSSVVIQTLLISFREKLLYMLMRLSDSQANFQEIDAQMAAIPVTPEPLIRSGVSVLLVVLSAILASGVVILRYKSRSLFEAEDF